MLTTSERDRLTAQWEQWDGESEAYVQAIRSVFGTPVRAIWRLLGRGAVSAATSAEQPRPGTA